MRRGRRGGHGVLEFGGSGEDSFVAVVVTKLTGALLFILLLVMVIMALLPKAADPAVGEQGAEAEVEPLAITTPERLPEAIAGRPYELALAATGGLGPLRWAIDGPLPDGMEFDPVAGLIRGTPEVGTPGPVELTVRVGDGRRADARSVALVVYRPDGPLSVPSPIEATLALPRLPWRAWGELGFGFLVLLLVHLVAMNGVAAMERRAGVIGGSDARAGGRPSRRFVLYRTALRMATGAAVVALAAWLWINRSGPSTSPVPEAATPAAIATARGERPIASR